MPDRASTASSAGRRTTWLWRRVPLVKVAVGHVTLYSLLSLAGPLADGRGVLALLLVARLGLGVATLVLLWTRRAPQLLGVAYLLLVLVTGLLDREYDALLVLLSALALLLTTVALVVGLLSRLHARRG